MPQETELTTTTTRWDQLHAKMEPHRPKVKKAIATAETLAAQLADVGMQEWLACYREIKGERHWRENGFNSLEDYAEQTWGFTDQRVRQLTATTKSRAAATKDSTQVPTEPHARALQDVPEEKREETLELATDLAKAEGKDKPSATDVAQAVKVAKASHGKELTPKARDAILGAATFRQLMGDIQRLRQRIKELADDPSGAFLSEDRVDDDLKNAWNALKFATPSKPCCYCETGYAKGVKKADGCKACHDRGWLSRGQYDAAPEDLRDLAEGKK